MVDGSPQLAYPVRLTADGARFATVETGSPEHLQQQVDVVLRTPAGARLLRPEFGRPDPTWTRGTTAEQILAAAVARHAPRAAAEFTGRQLVDRARDIGVTVGARR